MIYQAKLNNEVHWEAETLAELHNNILNHDYDTLPDFDVVALNDDGEQVLFDGGVFLNELRSDFQDSVIEAEQRIIQERGRL